MKLKLVNNWRQWWKFLSVRCALVGVALPQVWAQVPQDQRDAALDLVGLKGISAAVSILFALIIAVRVIKQQNLNQPE